MTCDEQREHETRAMKRQMEEEFEREIAKARDHPPPPTAAAASSPRVGAGEDELEHRSASESHRQQVGL
jgi:hypothetical protein